MSIEQINSRLTQFLLLAVLIQCGPALVYAQQDQEGDAIPITVSEVAHEDLAGTVPAAGTVFSRNAAQITAGLQARLEWVAEPGDYIEAGGPVARFDCEHIRLQREEQVAHRGRSVTRQSGAED